jgi:LPS sulfotransferase NodH
MTTGRTGSELLVSLLSSHPQIWCESEILSVRRILPAQMLLLRSARARRRGRAYGFKLLEHHARLQNPEHPFAYVRSFHDRGFKIIFLERRDWLLQAISSIRAIDTQYHYHRRDGARFEAIHVDPVAILSALWLIEQGVTALRCALTGVPTLKLFYEDDLETEEQQAQTVGRICTYLGLPPAPVHTELVKLTPRSAAQQLANFDQVAALISGTQYARFLNPEEAAAPRQ